MVFALGPWNVQVRINSSICFGVSVATSCGVRAAAKSLRDVGSVTSSSVRIEMMQAQRISNTDVYPSAYSSNIAALG
jgi:hypothetical protein